ncbi:PilZ domain-containing protein [Pelovirga terrestris]|nr:PilZ domain-containing protein [Pelovirga terrestris]
MMKCPKCQNYIRSALLAELQVIVCDQCQTQVPVDNVLISSNGFTFERNDLLKRFYRYRKLLDEVIEERNTMSTKGSVSEVSLRSIEKFMSVLQGMMAGARDHYRCEFTRPIQVRLRYLQQECAGSIYNMSMDGACIETAGRNPLPRVNGIITLSFQLPQQDHTHVITGEVCWTQKGESDGNRGHHSGVRFTYLDEPSRAVLWQFISTMAKQKLSAEQK